jgi:hypothetical protein
MRTALRHTRKLVHDETGALHASIPAFLCPALLRAPLNSSVLRSRPTASSQNFSSLRQVRQQQYIPLSIEPEPPKSHHVPCQATPAALTPSTLPRACPGCGAPTQLLDKEDAGYYDMERNVVRTYLNYNPEKQNEVKEESEVYTNRLKQLDPKLLEELGLNKEIIETQVEKSAPETPICDRCHSLIHHHTASSIHHPSVAAIQETIAESPHKRNHIYHVLDAADFPLSLIPNLQTSLRLPKLRTQNRRAKHSGWVGNNRIAEVSFIITRADLLAPLKEQVDKLMPYMQDVLRDALGRVNSKARLGNVRLVSAKRGWWTKQVKEDIWDRGGAGWMVGKVNVGKSNLFEVVFPKGRGAEYQDIRKVRTAAEREAMLSAAGSMEEVHQVQQLLAYEDAAAERKKTQHRNDNYQHEPPVLEEMKEEDDYDENSLLPPPQPYTPYPVLPIASSLPGTTASPIRIPFGRNRGELVDLPGLARTAPGLESFVKPEEQDTLVMKHRIAAERFVLTKGRSLILGGGLIRITPVNEDLVFLVHPFVPIHPHITSTEKAIGLETQTLARNIPSILTPSAPAQIKSAGRFQLKWDVTKKLAGPLTSAIAGKMKPENLPFRVWSTDLLIEGVGWVEVSAQVRRPKGWQAVGLVKKDPNHARYERQQGLEKRNREREEKFQAEDAAAARDGNGDAFDREGMSARRSRRDEDEDVYRNDGDDLGYEESYPEIEVFSPLGKFVGARMPMCGSVLGGPKQISARERLKRPRRSMVSVKGQRKSGGR